MPTPLISFPLDRTLQGRGWIDTSTATNTGAVRFEKGMAYIEGGTVNLETNPSAEVNTADWVASAGSLVRSTDVAHTGTASFCVTGTGTGITGVNKAALTIPSTYHALSFWAYHEHGADRLACVRYGGVNGPLFTVPTNTWTQVSRVLIGTGSPTDTVMSFTNAPSGQPVYIDTVQREESVFVSPYCPARDSTGLLQPGNVWNGVAESSASTRTAGDLALPCPQQPSSIALRYSEDGVTFRTIYSEALGQVIGSYGSITWSGGSLHIATSRRLWIDRVFAYDVPLNPKEQNHLRSSIEVGRADRDTLEPNQSVYLTSMWWLYR